MTQLTARFVEVCIFRFGGNGPEYLLLHRSVKESRYPGMWQIITGSMEEGEKALDAAIRELHEETGFTATALWAVPHVNRFYEPLTDTLNFIPMFAAQVPADCHPVLSTEHSESQWCTMGVALEKLVWPGQKEGLRIIHEYIVGDKEAARHCRIE